MVRIITKLDEVRREKAEKAMACLDFNIGTISGKLKSIVAAEEMDFKAGENKSIKIKKIDIGADTICFLSAYGSNKCGHTLAVGEPIPLPIKMERSADHAMFAAAFDCKIEVDDLLGVLIILPVNLLHEI